MSGREVLLATGSDGMIDRDGRPALFLELELLVEHAGLTPVEAIASATSNAARALGLADTGSIAVGKRADPLLVKGDPTVDVQHLRQTALVLQKGRVIADLR